MKAKFVLDENIHPRPGLSNNQKFIQFRRFARQGTPDWVLLEKLKEKDLIFVTRDKGMVLRALSECQDIVYEDRYGNQFFFYGRDNFQFAEAIPCRIDWKYHNMIKKSEKLANMKASKIALDGFDVVTNL